MDEKLTYRIRMKGLTADICESLEVYCSMLTSLFLDTPCFKQDTAVNLA